MVRGKEIFVSAYLILTLAAFGIFMLALGVVSTRAMVDEARARRRPAADR